MNNNTAIVIILGFLTILIIGGDILMSIESENQQENIVDESSFDSVYSIFNEPPHPNTDYSLRVEFENGKANKIIIEKQLQEIEK